MGRPTPALTSEHCFGDGSKRGVEDSGRGVVAHAGDPFRCQGSPATATMNDIRLPRFVIVT